MTPAGTRRPGKMQENTKASSTTRASPGTLPEGEGVIDQLAALGLKTSDLSCCILTHMDIDHAGGIGQVKDAGRILVSHAEWEAANRRNPRYLRRLWKDVPVQTFPDDSFDLFGDSSIVMVPMHGHSAGMTAVLVRGGKKYLVIAGDAGYGRASWERLVLPGVEWNRKETKEFLEGLRRMALDPDCEAVLMTHDPEKMQDVYEV